ncbi:MAG: phage holin family protein [Eubacteriales bacterium]
MELFGFTAVGSITVISYLVGKVVKASPWNNDQYIPIACGTMGGLLGLLGYVSGSTGFPSDLLSAIAVGIVSGLSATGVDQISKQLTQTIQTK